MGALSEAIGEVAALIGLVAVLALPVQALRYVWPEQWEIFGDRKRRNLIVAGLYVCAAVAIAIVLLHPFYFAQGMAMTLHESASR